VEQLDQLLGHEEGRVVLNLRPQRGMSLVELMIGLAIVAILLFVAVPSFSTFLQNTKIRNAAESVLTGLTTARNEAIRRNAPVRFQFVSDLTSGCALRTDSLAWIVSLSDPSGACDAEPSETAGPRILEKRSATEGTQAVFVETDASTVTFTGLGRLSGAGITTIDFKSLTGICQHLDPANGTMRCMRIKITTGGQTKLCDPKVVAPPLPDVDPRAC
jgi:type IV fimbrial biogenesis protein FimT